MGARMLDSAAGSGVGVLALAYKAKSVTAVDASLEAIVRGRLATGTRFVCMDACADMPDGPFDAATCIDVLGHMTHPFEALARLGDPWRRAEAVRRGDGRAAGAVPAGAGAARVWKGRSLRCSRPLGSPSWSGR